MSIKLFRCTVCGNVDINASAVVVFRAPVQLNASGEVRLDLTESYCHKKVDNAYGMLCYECEDGEMEIKEYETCPHEWREMAGILYSPRRYCVFCRTEQKGKVTYE